MRRVFVTGGAGFIGSHLVDRLSVDGVPEVIVLDNLGRGSVRNLRASWDRIRFIRADIRDKGALSENIAGADLVYHLAAESRVMDAEEDLERTFSTNVQGTFNVLSTALETGVRRVVFTSSREVYGDPKELPVPEEAPLTPKNAYGASKAAAELWCRVFQARGLEVVILRLANVYGPRDYGRVIPTFIGAARKGLPLVLYGGNQVLDFIWIERVVDALVWASTAKPEFVNQPLNVGSGVGTPLTALAERIRAHFGDQLPIKVEPSRSVEVERFVADTCRLKALLGAAEDGDPLAHLGELIGLLSSGPAQRYGHKTGLRRGGLDSQPCE